MHWLLATTGWTLVAGNERRGTGCNWYEETAIKIEQSRFKKPKMNKLHHGVFKIPHPDHTSDHT
jgi:hypothetical protein